MQKNLLKSSHLEYILELVLELSDTHGVVLSSSLLAELIVVLQLTFQMLQLSPDSEDFACDLGLS